jgi:mannose-6-phosphate isomerase-like protein (cupin superfamily)
MKQTFYELPELERRRDGTGKLYLEFLRIPEMSAGIYVLPVGGTDPQSPHKEDELYYVVRGKARMKAGAEDRAVAQGSVIFVAAEVEHRFYDISEELTMLVFFAPAEST